MVSEDEVVAALVAASALAPRLRLAPRNRRAAPTLLSALRSGAYCRTPRGWGHLDTLRAGPNPARVALWRMLDLRIGQGTGQNLSAALLRPATNAPVVSGHPC